MTRGLKNESTESVRSEPITLAKSDRFTGLLSFFLPGLGQVYQGAYGRGISLFLGFMLVCFFREGHAFLPLAAMLAGFESFRVKTKPHFLDELSKKIVSQWFQLPVKATKLRKGLFSAVAIGGFLAWFSLFAPSVYPISKDLDLLETIDKMAIEVKKERRQTGTLPQVVSGQWKDPWGSPIELSRLPEGFQLRSYGVDKTSGTKDDRIFIFK